jgi:hypothetical protein
MRLISLSIIALSCLCSINTQAQKVKPRLKDLPLNSLEAFKQPATNWQIIGDVLGSYNDTTLNIAKGTGILFNNYSRAIQFKPGHQLFSNLEHGDIILEFDFMIPKGSNSGIYLQSRYEVQINDSWGVTLPKHGDLGGIYERWEDGKGFEGKAPLKNASFAPGLWQRMEISFLAPRFDASGNKTQSAKFNYIRVNGITLHENIFVSGPTRAAAFEDEKPYGPFMIQGDHGPIAIRNFRYAPQDELKVSVKDITYSYYENTAKTPEEAIKIKPTSQGKVSSIDSRLASARDKYFIQFEGKLQVPVKDQYTFSMHFSGDGSLEIDGKPVIAPGWTHLGGFPLDGTTTLEAGEHQLKLWVNKDINWSRSGLSLYIEKPNSRAVALHSPASMPERAPEPLIAVKAQASPEIIRSFMNHQGKKLTHVLSVGDPTQIHYSYDLMQGGILQVWKGEFLNTTDMWHERGEPQTASPLGAPVVLAGNCPVFDKSLKKDSITDYQYKGYTLTASNQPVFSYQYKNLRITDALVPAEQGRGLKRTLIINGDGREKVMFRIAQGKNITPIGGGLYNISNGAYFIQISPALFPRIENYLDQQVLVLPGQEFIQYNIIW